MNDYDLPLDEEELKRIINQIEIDEVGPWYLPPPDRRVPLASPQREPYQPKILQELKGDDKRIRELKKIVRERRQYLQPHTPDWADLNDVIEELSGRD